MVKKNPGYHDQQGSFEQMFLDDGSLQLEGLIERLQDPRDDVVVYPNKEAKRHARITDFMGYLDATGEGAYVVEQDIRHTIYNRYNKTNLEKIISNDTDKRSLPNRVRINERIYGGNGASIVIADEIRKDNNKQKLLGGLASALEDPKLHEKNVTEKSYNYFSLFQSAIEADREDGEAAKYLHALAKLWIVNTAKEHEVWEETLKRYNRQFPRGTIDPENPATLI